MIHPARIQPLNRRAARRGDFVLYWMQQAQRARYNHALEYAVDRANEFRLPVVVYFGLTDRFPEANLRHYHFMLHGLKEVSARLNDRGITFVLRVESPDQGALRLARRASMIITDRGYLHLQRSWRAKVAAEAPCSVVQVESDVVVPIETASGKQEYAARTIRPRIMRRLDDFLVPLTERPVANKSSSMSLRGAGPLHPDKLLRKLDIDTSVGEIRWLKPGEEAAIGLLREFIEHKLDRFGEDRNDPSRDGLSNLSPYLHFGRISPLLVAREVSRSQSPGTHTFLEEFVVRRELSMNFAAYNPSYDSWDGVPQWARQTLENHRTDKRPSLYTARRLEQAETHDPFWNAAQKEMVLRGKMHGYMRMYWGKKILEWSSTPRRAHRTALYLNNRWSLDGRDANGFTGVSWCFGLHDRPWTERPVFGSVRYMNDRGLKRKFDIDAYVEKVEALSREGSE